MQLDELIPRHTREAMEAVRRIEEAIPQSARVAMKYAREINQSALLSQSVRDALDTEKKFRALIPQSVLDASALVRKIQESHQATGELARVLRETEEMRKFAQAGRDFQDRLAQMASIPKLDAALSALHSIDAMQSNFPHSVLRPLMEVESTFSRLISDMQPSPDAPLPTPSRIPPTHEVPRFEVGLTDRARRYVCAICGDAKVTVPTIAISNLGVGDHLEFEVEQKVIHLVVLIRRVISSEHDGTRIQILLDAASEPRPESVTT